MTATTSINVLVVDDVDEMAAVLKDCFTDRNQRDSCPYRFEVDVAGTTRKCVEMCRAKFYDVVVLDIRMEEEELESGLQLAFAMFTHERAGFRGAVRIVVTGYPTYKTCVLAMRSGAWDYLIKEDFPGPPIGVRVVDSAVQRLRALDLRRDLERLVAVEWLPKHLAELRPKYDGQLVAIWHDPEVRIIASGGDSFDLEDQLRDWRRAHAEWEEPFIVRMPTRFVDDQGA